MCKHCDSCAAVQAAPFLSSLACCATYSSNAQQHTPLLQMTPRAHSSGRYHASSTSFNLAYSSSLFPSAAAGEPAQDSSSLMGLLGEEPAPPELTDKSSPTLTTFHEKGGEQSPLQHHQASKRQRTAGRGGEAGLGESAFHGQGTSTHHAEGGQDSPELCDGAADAEQGDAEVAGGSHPEPDDADQDTRQTTTTLHGITM